MTNEPEDRLPLVGGPDEMEHLIAQLFWGPNEFDWPEHQEDRADYEAWLQQDYEAWQRERERQEKEAEQQLARLREVRRREMIEAEIEAVLAQFD